MSVVPIEIAGQTGGHKSVQFNSEVTQNMYLDLLGQRKGVHDFPGLKSFGSVEGEDRGWHVMAGVLYKLCGTKLYRVTSGGVYNEVGSVWGSERAIFADDGETLYFTVESQLWKYDGQLVTITQDVVENPSSIEYINRQFIITGDDGLFGTSDVGDGDTYNSLNFAESETSPDALIRAYKFNQLIYMMGADTTELWYNSGVGNPPFARQDTALVNVGLAGKYAVTNSDSFLYWIGDDRKVYQCVGSQARHVASPSIAHLMEDMDTVSDCIASRAVIEGQDMIVFSFPSANKTLMFSETHTYWVCLSSGLEGDRWYGNAVIRCYEKNLVSDYRNGNVYELDLDTYTDNGDERIRIRTLPSFSGDLIQHKGQVTVGNVRINMEVGTGLSTGQGVNPVLMCEFSPDGGRTWQAEQQVTIGEMGDYKHTVDFWDFSTGYEVRCRISCSDPVYLSMFDGFVELEAAGF